jgi:hypothetical protein
MTQAAKAARRMLDRILDIAEELATVLTADIPLAKTREEHIRVTARANQATELLNEILAYHKN